MIAGNSDPTAPDILDLRVQLEVMKEKVNHHLERIAQLEQKLTEADIEIDIRENELKQAITQINEQKTQIEKAKYQEEKTAQLEHQLTETQDKLDIREHELTKAISRINEQKTQIAVLNEKVKQFQKHNTNDKLQSFLASLLFMLSAGLASMGYNLVTTTSPSSLGTSLIVMAIVSHVVAAIMVIFGKGDGNS